MPETRPTPLIAGVDEAGRGPLAGPVVCAAVILPANFSALDQLDDSKKLSEKRRTTLSAIIRAEARVGVGIAEPVEIDRLNVLHATMAAMVRAVEGLGVGLRALGALLGAPKLRSGDHLHRLRDLPGQHSPH